MKAFFGITVILYILSLLIKEAVLQGDSFMLVADGFAERIYSFQLDGTQLSSLRTGNGSTPHALDYDPYIRKIFWTDDSYQTINMMNTNGTDNQVVLRLIQESSPQGIAVDPRLELIFYTDMGLQSLSVVKYSGQDHRTLVSFLNKPRDIQLDRVENYVYWSDWEADRIERCRYDGSERQIIVQQTDTWINGVALDTQERLLYFVEAYHDFIWKVNMDDGTGLTTVLQLNDTGRRVHPFGLVKVRDALYYTDWEERTVYRVDLVSLDRTIIPSFSFTRLVSGIVIYTADTYVPGSQTSPCLVNNGGCSHLCLPLDGVTATVCACPDGLELNSDQSTCVSVDPFASGPDVVWLEHDGDSTSYVRGITGTPRDFIDLEHVRTWLFRNPFTQWSALDFSFERHLLFLADRETRIIYEMQLDNSLLLNQIHSGLSSQVYGLAYDWLTDNLYYTDALFNWIKVIKRATPIYRKTILKDLDQPHGIAVHPVAGKLFWTDWGLNPRVEGSDLLGESRFIVNDVNTIRPTGITVDYDNDRIYWSDTAGIYSSLLDGTNVIYFGGTAYHNFVDIAFHDGYVIATDLGYNTSFAPQLMFYNVGSPEMGNKSIHLTRAVSGVTMYHEDLQFKPPIQFWRDCEFRCSHLCLTAGEGDVRCACSDGYEYRSDLQCIAAATTVEPMYIYSMGHQLCKINVASTTRDVVNPQSRNCFYSSPSLTNHFQALDFDFQRGLLYFAEITGRPGTIRRTTLHALANNSIVVSGVSAVYGLAVDWIADNLYWTESGHGQLWVSRTSGAYQTQLLNNLNDPRAICLDLRRGYLFWSEVNKIRRAYLDGSDVQDFVTIDGANITDIKISYRYGPNDRLFWTDANTGRVQSALLDGTDRQELDSLPGLSHLYGLAIFEDHLALSGSGDNGANPGIRILDLPAAAQPTQITHSSPEIIYDVIAYYDNNQPLSFGTGNASCSHGNTICDQLCLGTETSWRCACMDGLVYDTNRRSCVSTSIMQENFLLIADDYRHIIYQVNAGDYSEISAIKVPALDRPLGLAYDYILHTIFYTEFKSSSIKGVDLFANTGQAMTIKHGRYGYRIDGLAVDVLSKLIYYSDTQRHLVGIISYDGRIDRILITQLQSAYIANPRAIVLDPNQGYMYIAVRSPGAIVRADMDGENLIAIVDSGLSWPSGLDIDIPGGTLYYADGHTEFIGAVDVDGNNQRTIHRAEAVANPYSVTKQGDLIFWTDWYLEGIFSTDIATGETRNNYGANLFAGPNDIIYFNNSRSMNRIIGDGRCTENNGGCSDLCIPVPSGVKCACAHAANGDEVVPGDGQDCSVPTCPTSIRDGTFLKPCDYRPGAACEYKCVPGKGKTYLSHLTCGIDLAWERDLSSLCADPCPSLQLPEHSEWVGTVCSSMNVAPGIMCRHACAPGYERSGGSELRTCQQDLTWSGAPFQCRHKGFCTGINVENANVYPSSCRQNQSSHVGTSCQFNCSSGYSLTGSTSSTCLDSLQWTEFPVCVQNEPAKSSHATKKKKEDSITVPVAVAVLLVIFLLAALLLIVIFVMKRKHKKKGAKYRSSQQEFQGSEDAPRVSPDEINASYDVRQDSVTLDGSRAFENPMYKNVADVEKMKGDMRPSEEVSPQTDTKVPLSDSDIQVEINANTDHSAYGYDIHMDEAASSFQVVQADRIDISTGDRTAFANPMYDSVNGAGTVETGAEAGVALNELKKDGNPISES